MIVVPVNKLNDPCTPKPPLHAQFTSRHGYHVTDKATYLKLKTLRNFVVLAHGQLRRHLRWYMKKDKRSRKYYTTMENGQRHTSVVIGDPIPEPICHAGNRLMCWLVFDGHVQANSQTPQQIVRWSKWYVHQLDGLLVAARKVHASSCPVFNSATVRDIDRRYRRLQNHLRDEWMR